MNMEAQLTTMMVLSAALALSDWALVYLSSTRDRPNGGQRVNPSRLRRWLDVAYARLSKARQ
jgi:hypothetical protein